MNGVVDERLPAALGSHGLDPSLHKVLVDAVALVQQAKCGLESVDDVTALWVIEALVIDARKSIDEPDVPRLRQDCVTDERPRRQEAIQAAGVFVVAEDAGDLQHDRTSPMNGACLAGSYRRRTFDDERRIRSICGSCFVDQKAKA